MDVSDRLYAKADDCDRAAGGLAILHPDLSARERLRATAYRTSAQHVSVLESGFLDGINTIAKKMNDALQGIEEDFEAERKKHD